MAAKRFVWCLSLGLLLVPLGCGGPEPIFVEDGATESWRPIDGGGEEKAQDVKGEEIEQPDEVLLEPQMDSGLPEAPKVFEELSEEEPTFPEESQSVKEAFRERQEYVPERVPEQIPDRPKPPEPSLPAFSHFDKVVDWHRGTVDTWATLVYAKPHQKQFLFKRYSYKNTGDKHNFWPASTIKIYATTAALVLLKQYGLSLDTSATFYRKSGSGWTKDTTQTFRKMITDTITCSSNTYFTLLLRFAGADWLNKQFFTKANGFSKTSLMRGYSGSRPWYYGLSEPQRIVLKDGTTSIERTHTWSKTRYSDQVKCSISNASGTANCSTLEDMTEHMRRLFFHEYIPTVQRFNVRQSDLNWYRYGTPKQPIFASKCSPTGRNASKKVFPKSTYYHKPGSVNSYKLDTFYLADKASNTHFLMSMATRSSSKQTLEKLIEEVARMVQEPDHYVDLRPLKDNVNPIQATVNVYSRYPATLELLIKPYSQSASAPGGWTVLSGSAVKVSAGISTHNIRSACLKKSEKLHIRGRLRDAKRGKVAYSDLHFVIVKASIACP